MTPKQVKDIFDKLPPKRRKVLVGFLAGHSREKIMIDADIPSDAALTGHLKELYKNFRIDTGWNDADDRRSGARKLPLLISLFARCMPELISDRIAEVPDGVEQEEAIAKPYQEAVESDAGSVEERIFRATEQLNRRGFSALVGIQALEEIAKDSSRYHWKIMELLAAFVRNAPRRKEEEGIPDDIQAALTVIGRRNPDSDKKSLNLRNTEIRGANLFGADLRGAYLNGADLREVCLTTANLKGAVLWEANLEGAKLDIANLEEAKLSKTNLQSANFSCSILRRADLSGAKLQDANLSGADLRKADLTGANLERAYLYGANLQESSLMRTKGQRADFRRAYFRGADLSGADFSRAINLTSAQIAIADGFKNITLLPEHLNTPEHWVESL